MRKSILFGGSILCLFILVSLSYQPMVADVKINDYKLYAIYFFIGSISNLHYSEQHDGLYFFNCSNVQNTYWIKRFGLNSINYNSGEGMFIILNYTSNSTKWVYHGHISEEFICGFQIMYICQLG